MKNKKFIQNTKRGRPRGPASMSAAAKHRAAGLHSALPGKRNGDDAAPALTPEAQARYLASVERAQDAKTALAESKARTAKREEALAAGQMVTRAQADRWLSHLYAMMRHTIDVAPVHVESLGLDEPIKAPLLKVLGEVCRKLRLDLGSMPPPLSWGDE